METILNTILKQKQIEVLELKRSFENASQRSSPVSSFYDKFKNTQEMQVIAEYKRSSPSKGVINDKVRPEEQAVIYEKAGASMISVLTDEPFFKGTMEDLAAVREAVDLPILNKDFFIDTIQIDRAYAYGADVILLIVAALTDEQLRDLNDHAQGLGLEVLVEVHNEYELKRAQAIHPKLIGVNNRNLKTFEVNVNITEQLAQLIDTEKQVLVSESGMTSVKEVRRARQAGARAILVGERLMKADNVKDTIQSFKIGEDHHVY